MIYKCVVCGKFCKPYVDSESYTWSACCHAVRWLILKKKTEATKSGNDGLTFEEQWKKMKRKTEKGQPKTEDSK